MTDPIADLLTRIRNGLQTQADSVAAPFSAQKKAVLQVLKENGYIRDWEAVLQGARGMLKVHLKYGPDGEQVIQHIRRVSKPGRRVYVPVRDIAEPLSGLGLAVISTSKGIVSHTEAKKLNLGGEVLCEVW
jgi:small subunit ribosomal protein S8